jgi:hypothetical protein
MISLKKDATRDTVDSISRIETVADAHYKALRLLNLPKNISIWGLLVGGIKLIEEEISARGDDTFDLTATLLNVSRFLPVGIKWMHRDGKPVATLVSRQWSAGLSILVDEAIAMANEYSAFLTRFPMWHQQRYAAELISPAAVRFTALASERGKQVSAFQKGFRPKEGPYRWQRPPKPPQTPRVQELFQHVFDLCKQDGHLGFSYQDPWDLWRELEREYYVRVEAMFRRKDTLSLGLYTLGEFKKFYSAFLAVCAAHEFLCFSWAKNYASYPFDSAVLVRSRSNWVATLAFLNHLRPDRCEAMISDLTFDLSRSVDLHIHPFVALDSSGKTLAVAPQFPLHSRADENILRVSSMVRPKEFDVSSLSKEGEMLAGLTKACSRYTPQGPISLPKPIPDIDLLLSDERSSTVLLVEMKWIRKTVRPVEIKDRDAEVLKGINQLQQIQGFLLEHPEHLSESGRLPKPMNEYKNVRYFLVARDHWLWVEPNDRIAIVEYEEFLASVLRSTNLLSAINELLSYEWLPVLGRDFTIKYDRATVDGVSLESEVYYGTEHK